MTMILYAASNVMLAFFHYHIVALRNLKKCSPITMVIHVKNAVASVFLTVLNVRSVGTGSIIIVLDCQKKILSPSGKIGIGIFSVKDVKCASTHFIL